MTRVALLVSVITTAAAIAFLVVGFLGSNPHADGLNKVYWSKLDTGDTGTFTIGTAGYCHDDKCYTGHVPFYFDIEKYVTEGDTSRSVKSEVKDMFSKSSSDIESRLKKGGIAIYILTLAAVACYALAFFISVIAFLLSCCSRTVGKIIIFFGIFFCFLGVVAYGAAAGTGTAIYTKLRDEFEDSNGTDASLGTSGLGVYWAGFVLGLVSLLAMNGALFSRRRQESFHGKY